MNPRTTKAIKSTNMIVTKAKKIDRPAPIRSMTLRQVYARLGYVISTLKRQGDLHRLDDPFVIRLESRQYRGTMYFPVECVSGDSFGHDPKLGGHVFAISVKKTDAIK